MDDRPENRPIWGETTTRELDRLRRQAKIAYGSRTFRQPRVEPLRPSTLYLCQLCGDPAIWPRENRHTFHFPFGRTWAVVYETPMVCSTCRMMRHPEAKGLGDGRRRFWKRAIHLWRGEMYPSAGPWMRRLIAYRLTLGKYPDPVSVALIVKDAWRFWRTGRAELPRESR